MPVTKSSACLQCISLCLVAMFVCVWQVCAAGDVSKPVDFAQDIRPILNKNCTTCHRPGGLGPFSLLDYDSAKTNVTQMREAVSTGQALVIRYTRMMNSGMISNSVMAKNNACAVRS